MLEGTLARRLRLALLLQALLLLLEPAGVVALIGNAAAAIELEDPAGDIVEEIAVVGHRHDGAGIIRQEALQPRHGFRVEMIGGLVQQQQVRPLQQQAAECHAAALAARELADVGVARRAAQRIHGDLDGALELPAIDRVDLLLQLALLREERVHLVVGELLAELVAHCLEAIEERLHLAQPLGDIAGDRLLGIERRLLGEITHLGALGRPGLAVKLLLHPRHDLQQRRLAGAVGAEHTDLGAGKERQVDVVQHLPAAGIGFRETFHHIDVLVGRHRTEFPVLSGRHQPLRGRRARLHRLSRTSSGHIGHVGGNSVNMYRVMTS